MDAAAEFAKKFPDEKIKSVSRVRVKPAPLPGQPQKKALMLTSKTFLVVSKGFAAFVFDPMIYYAIMALLLVLSAIAAIALLLSSMSIVTFVALIMGFIGFLIAEAFLYLEIRRSGLTAFDRAASQIEFDKEKKEVRITGVPVGGEWLNEKKSFIAILEEGEGVPAF